LNHTKLLSRPEIGLHKTTCKDEENYNKKTPSGAICKSS